MKNITINTCAYGWFLFWLYTSAATISNIIKLSPDARGVEILFIFISCLLIFLLGKTATHRIFKYTYTHKCKNKNSIEMVI